MHIAVEKEIHREPDKRVKLELTVEHIRAMFDTELGFCVVVLRVCLFLVSRIHQTSHSSYDTDSVSRDVR